MASALLCDALTSPSSRFLVSTENLCRGQRIPDRRQRSSVARFLGAACCPRFGRVTMNNPGWRGCAGGSPRAGHDGRRRNLLRPRDFGSLLALRKVSSSRRPTVCLISFHPLLLSEFERLLSGENEARVLEQRVEANQLPEASLSLPRASVYVVEAHTHRQVTEAYVGAILGRFPKARMIVIAEKLSGPNVFPLLRQGVKGLL